MGANRKVLFAAFIMVGGIIGADISWYWRPKPPPGAPTAWCALNISDGDMMLPGWMNPLEDEDGHLIRLNNEIRSPDGYVPCSWLNRKPNI